MDYQPTEAEWTDLGAWLAESSTDPLPESCEVEYCGQHVVHMIPDSPQRSLPF